MTSILLAFALAAPLVGTAAAAAADPVDVGDPRMTVPAGQAVLYAQLEVSLAKDAVFEPVSIAPDLWYGVDPRLTLGLVHGGRATSGFFGGAGDGLCLTGERKGCPRVYDRAGLLARYHLKDGPFTVALDGGLLVQRFEPFTVSLKAGVAARWHRGKLALDLTPNLWLGLSERGAGNRDRLNLPVGVMYEVAPRVAVGLQTGLAAPIEDLVDDFAVPFSVGAELLASDQLFVELAYSLPALIDNKDATGAFDLRTLTLGVGYGF